MAEEGEAEEEVKEIKYPGLPEDVKIVEERVYVIPLWKVRSSGRGLHRTKKAVNYLKRFVSRHMKNPNIKISTEVNEELWKRGIRNPPRRIKVKIVRTSEDIVWVLPYKE